MSSDSMLNCERSITADTALRLSRYFPSTSARFWLNMQIDDDLEFAEDDAGESIAQEVRAYRE